MNLCEMTFIGSNWLMIIPVLPSATRYLTFKFYDAVRPVNLNVLYLPDFNSMAGHFLILLCLTQQMIRVEVGGFI